jgi:hypothetical protein
MNRDPPQAADAPADAPAAAPPSGSHGWRSGGFALVVIGIAGLLFHLNEGVSILDSHLGRISIGLIVAGLVLIVAGTIIRARRGGPPPAAG